MSCHNAKKTVQHLERDLKKARARNCELELALLHLSRLYTQLANDWLPEHLDAVELEGAKAKSLQVDLERTALHVTRVYDSTQGVSDR